MAFNPIAGPSGSVLIGGVAYAFGKWRFQIKAGLPRVNNFTSAYQLLVTGIVSGTLTIDGPYDGGNMPLSIGLAYVFTLRFNNSISLVATAVLGDITPSQDVEDAARLSISAETSGTFTAAVV